MGVVDRASELRAAFEARRAWWGAEAGTLIWQPPPPAEGDPAAARRLAKGLLLFDGHLVELPPGATPWGVTPPGAAWSRALHGHGWIDDAAAFDDLEARTRFSVWIHAWIAAYGQGTGPGWTPQLVARRQARWIAHAAWILRGAEQEQSHAFFRALSAQARFLDRLWRRAAPGVDRLEAVAGLLFSRLSLETGGQPEPAIREIGHLAAELVDQDGEVPGRSPEDVLRLAELLAWLAQMIRDAEFRVDDRHDYALERLRPTLAALRHADGRLARFHGGRGGSAQAVARALGAHPRAAEGCREVLGYVRLARGGKTLILDAAPSETHASALAIEFTAGAHPVIVSAGSGLGFGDEAEREGRGTASHSALVIGRGSHATGPGSRVQATVTEAAEGAWILGENDGWRPALGLVHERRLHLDPEGAVLSGEDTVVAGSQADRARLARAMPADLGPRRMTAQFLIHPDSDVALALGGRAAVITLPGGSRWMMRSDGAALSIAPARYFDAARIRPRATKRILVAGDLLEYWGRVTWSLKALPPVG